MAEVVEAATDTIGAHASTTIGLSGLSLGGRAMRILVRTPSSGVYVGNSGVAGASTGYELNANQEYVFVLRPTLGNASAAASQINVYNSNGSSAVVSWLVTMEE